MELKQQLLEWIREDSSTLEGEGRSPIVPIHLLLVKAALLRRQGDASASESVELSLQIFERAAVGRHLRDLLQERHIAFVDADGEKLPVDEVELSAFTAGEPSKIKHVMLSDKLAKRT